MPSYPARRIAATVLAACVLLPLSLEALLRLRETFKAVNATNDHGEWSLFSPEFGWERRPGFHAVTDLDGIPRAFDAQGYFSVDSKKLADSSKRKVIFIGDSNTFGFGVDPSKCFAEKTNEYLPGIDTVNLGVAGYTSFQGWKVLRKYGPLLNPAAVVVSFNPNDRREVYAGDSPDSDARFRKIYAGERSVANKLNAALSQLRTYDLLRRGMRKIGLLRRPAPDFRVDLLRPRVNESQYRNNLESMAAWTESRGIPMVFIVFRDNPLLAGYLRQGIASLNAGRYREAELYLTRLIQRPNSFTHLARMYMSRVYRAEGRSADADRMLYATDRSESLHGGLPVRLDSTYNDVMRDVARKHHAVLIEAADTLDADPYVYIDDIHFNAVGHRRVAKLIAAALVGPLDQRVTTARR